MDETKELDTITWCAIYDNGEAVWECDVTSLKTNDGLFYGNIINKYGKLDRKKLTAFSLYSTADLLYMELEDCKPVVTIDLKPGYRLIWRKRQRLVLTGAVRLPTIYLVGWQATIPTSDGDNGTNVQSILYVYPDGHLEMSCRKSDFELFEFEKGQCKEQDKATIFNC